MLDRFHRTRGQAPAWVLLVAFAGSAARLCGQSGELTLEEAVRLALEYNRSIQQAALDQGSAAERIASARTKRLPAFKLQSLTGQLLTRSTVTFDKGAFGNFPGVGPIPGTTTKIETARQPSEIFNGEISLPLSQQYRIGLGLKQLEIGKQQASEQIRLTRQEVVSNVRRTYYAILEAQGSLEALEDTGRLYRELAQLTGNYVKVGTALPADLLSVNAKLAQIEYDKASLQGPLETRKEELNQLLGRPIDTGFRPASNLDVEEVSGLPEARRRALDARPEIRQARLKIQQAELDRRVKKSEYIPDVSLTVNYISSISQSSLAPRNIAVAGIQTTWEPFDWGRRRRELSEKENAVRQASLGLKDVEEKVRIEVGNAYRKIREARLLLAASRAAQENAREAVRLASVRFRHDSALLKSVLEAQADLANANDAGRKAMLAYWSARAELDKAMGEEL